MPNETFEEKTPIGDVVHRELPNYASRRLKKIASGAGVLKLGQVLGAVLLGELSSAKVGAGNGTLTGLAAKDLTVPGDYVLTCYEEVAEGGVFSVVTPDGTRLADAKVGVAYDSPHIAFQINDGAADFDAGDKFTITVAAAEGALKKCVVGAVDGSQTATAILLQDVDATAAAVEDVLVLWREAQVDATSLIYDASADNADKKAAQRKDLEDKGVQFLPAA